MTENFKLTYATMYDPPAFLHEKFEEALAAFEYGKEYPLLIGGKEVFSENKIKNISPINTDNVVGVFQKASKKEANLAIEAAHKAFEVWGKTPWQERVRVMRKAADLISERIFEISAAITLEVGKNRMEALGDAAETADLIRYACDQLEENNGFVIEMNPDPLSGYTSRNVSYLRPYGVWLVISPFNFPCALSGGPVGAALVAGNTVVMKPASDTTLSPYLVAKCLIDAGLPEGALNLVTGSGREAGQSLVDHPLVAGVTFTGSKNVGMGIYRDYANGDYVRPIILELGGKNPCIVTKNANLEDASTGIVRSAFGLQGQKCSANSRVYIHEDVYDELVGKIVEKTKALKIANPTLIDANMGPVVNKAAYEDYQKYVADLKANGVALTGGDILTEGEFANGYYCEPAVFADVPADHYLWKHEMFLPITMLAKYSDVEEAMKIANDVPYGLTAGFYGTEEEAAWFFENIEAGVCYANRPQGSTTGAWPGHQPFGGWKGSGAQGKSAGGHHYLQIYMREQSTTLVWKN